MDAILKIYNRGNLNGKFALFFKSDKAISTAKKIGVKPVTDGEDTAYIIAGSNNEENVKKAESFLNDWQLHYEIIILS